HPDRRRVEIVELTGTRRPDIRPHGEGHDQDGERQHHEEDAHAAAWCAGAAIGAASIGTAPLVKLWPNQLPSTTVSDDAGIITAATSGESHPSMARATPTA